MFTKLAVSHPRKMADTYRRVKEIEQRRDLAGDTEIENMLNQYVKVKQNIV